MAHRKALLSSLVVASISLSSACGGSGSESYPAFVDSDVECESHYCAFNDFDNVCAEFLTCE